MTPTSHDPHAMATTQDRRDIVDRALRNLEQGIGGREALLSVLYQYPNPSVDQQRVIGLLGDPGNDHYAIGRICRAGGVSIGELLRLFTDAKLAKAQLDSIVRVAEGLPDVVENVMTRAVPHFLRCERCLGSGKVTVRHRVKDPDNPGVDRREKVIEDCTCEDGQVHHIPTLAYQKLALELGGLHKQQGITLNMNQQNVARQNVFTAGMMDDLRAETDKIMYPPRKRGETVGEEVVEAKVVEDRE